MSLRLRLLLLLVGLAAAGLVVFGVIAYRSLHGYLYDRVDQQVVAALGRASFELTGGPPPPPAGGAPSIPAPPTGGPAPGPQLPPGTYAELRSARGKVVRRVLFTYGQRGLARPRLPRSLPRPQPGTEPTLSTVGAARGADASFRVGSQAAPGGGSVVVAVPLAEAQSTLDRLAAIELVAAAVILAGLAASAWWLIRLGLRPLERISTTADEIAAGDLSKRVEETDPRTEAGRLGIALNRMLGQIEEAFAEREASERRMRRFLADASHELRTPLTSIRGYAELFRRGARDRPRDLETAMSRIEQESRRMGGLLDDLLTLARLDSVREPLRERVELASLLGEACEDARVASPGRRISLGADQSLRVEGDPDLLRQVIANLLRNATVHTPPGTPVEVELRREGERALLTVRDHGPGLGAEAEGGELFGRFWRAEAARGVEDGGAGLGLSIVAAAVAAHGGEVGAENAAGGGALFTVALPLEGAGRGRADPLSAGSP